MATSEVSTAPVVAVNSSPGTGDVPTVVFVHGSMDRSSSFLKTIKRLGDVPTIRVDRPGYGNSEPFPPSLRPDLSAQSRAVLSAIPSGRDVVLAGHSFGAIIALACASTGDPRIRAVAAYEPPVPDIESPRWDPVVYKDRIGELQAGTTDEIGERGMRRVVGDDLFDELPIASQAMARREGRGYAADLWSFQHEVIDFSFPAVPADVPVVYGYGTGDGAYYKNVTLRAARDTPTAAVVVYPDATHGIHQRRPGLFADLVTAALSTVVPVDEWLTPEEIMGEWAPGSGDWDWETEIKELRTRTRLAQLNSVTKVVNAVRLPVLLGNDGRMWDGHHRLISAYLCGVPLVPVRHAY